MKFLLTWIGPRKSKSEYRVKEDHILDRYSDGEIAIIMNLKVREEWSHESQEYKHTVKRVV